MFPGSFSPATGPETLRPFLVPAHAAFWTMLVVCPRSCTETGVYICLINLKGHLNLNLVCLECGRNLKELCFGVRKLAPSFDDHL